MAQAIVVKRLPASNNKPARYSISCFALKRPMVIRKSPGGIDKTPRDAALIVCEKFNWGSDYVEGCLPNGDAVFVSADKELKRLRFLEELLKKYEDD